MLIKTFSPLSDLVFRHIPNTHTSCIESGITPLYTTSFTLQSPASGITNWKSGLLLSAAVGAGLSLPSGGYLMQMNGAVYRRSLQGYPTSSNRFLRTLSGTVDSSSSPNSSESMRE